MVATSINCQMKREISEVVDASEIEGSVELTAYIQSSNMESAVKRKKKKNDINIPFETLCADVIPIIYDMLGCSKSLFNLASCSKYLLSLLTPKIVIRAAVFSQGHSEATISNVMECIRQRSIFVPSTLRLLRLVNGYRCERLDQCFNYNFLNHKSGQANTVQNGLGILLCQGCESVMTTRVLKDCRWILDEKRVASTYHYNSKMLTLLNPNAYCTEAGTGDPVGPLFSFREVKQITNTIPDLQGRKKILQIMLREADKADRNAASANKLIEYYDEAKRDYVYYSRRREEERKSRMRELASKRLASLRKIYCRFEELFADEPWKDIALDCTWHTNLDAYVHVKFTCSIVNDMLNYWKGPFDKPDKTTENMIQLAAKNIKENFDILYSRDFFSFSFLKIVKNSYRRAAYYYCQANMPPAKILMNIPELYSTMKGDDFITLVRKNKLFTALLVALYRHDDALENIFAVTVIDRLGIDSANPELPKLSALAKSLWKKESASRRFRHRSSSEMKEEILDQVTRCYDKFILLRGAIDLYKVRPGTISFLGEDRLGGDRYGFTRLDSFNTVYSMSSCHNYLLNREFGQLLNHHRQIYENPELYDIPPRL